MRRLLPLPLPLIAAAALAPAAVAADTTVHLTGAPTLHRVDAKVVQVGFTTDKPLPRRADGMILGDVKVHGHVSSIASGSRRKNDYTSFTKLGAAKRGSKFTVIIEVKGQPAVARVVTLR